MSKMLQKDPWVEVLSLLMSSIVLTPNTGFPPKVRSTYEESVQAPQLEVKVYSYHGVSVSVDITTENIQNEIRKIQSILKDYAPENILNFDETGLFYQQAPRRTICSAPLGGLKKSKKRLTIRLLCNADGTYKSHPIVIGNSKHPTCFDTRARLLAKTAVRNSHHVEYHHSPSAWMTSEIFTSYIKRLDVAFRREGRHVALLLDNASVHNIKITLTNIVFVFLPANTSSKLQALDAGITANFKTQFRAIQYDRALTQYLTKQLNNVYEMDQVQAMIYIATSWGLTICKLMNVACCSQNFLVLQLKITLPKVKSLGSKNLCGKPCQHQHRGKQEGVLRSL